MTARDRRVNGLDHHHLIPKSRGGSKKPYNMIAIKPNRHRAWHQLFGTMTLDEIINFLSVRTPTVAWMTWGKFSHVVGDVAWYTLFRNLGLQEVIALLKRLKHSHERLR